MNGADVALLALAVSVCQVCLRRHRHAHKVRVIAPMVWMQSCMTLRVRVKSTKHRHIGNQRCCESESIEKKEQEAPETWSGSALPCLVNKIMWDTKTKQPERRKGMLVGSKCRAIGPPHKPSSVPHYWCAARVRGAAGGQPGPFRAVRGGTFLGGPKRSVRGVAGGRRILGLIIANCHVE